MAHSREEKRVSAFDAKTHLSALLREVERGACYTITRRGRPVARLEPVAPSEEESMERLLEEFRGVRARVKGKGGIRELIEEGRRR